MAGDGWAMPLGLRTGNAYRRAGNRYRDAGQWAQAARAYRRHLARRPDDAVIWVQLGHAEKEQGRIEAAEVAYRRAVAIDDQDADPLLHLAHLLAGQQRADDAFEAFQRLDRLSPSAETSHKLRDLAQRRGHRAAITSGKGALLFVVEDYLASFCDDPGRPAARIEPSLVEAALRAPLLEAHFIVYDGSDRTGEPRFVAIDRAAMRDIARYDDGGHLDPRLLPSKAIAARRNAVPISPGPDSLIVVVGRLWEEGNGIGRFLAAQARGTRLVAYIDDVGRFVAGPSSGGRWQDAPRALTEYAHGADVLVVASDRQRDQLIAMIGTPGEDRAEVAILRSDERVTVGGRVRRAFGRGTDQRGAARAGKPPRRLACAGRELIATAQLAGSRYRARRYPGVVALPSAFAFRPGAATDEADRPSGPVEPLRLMFGPTFHRVDLLAAWMSGVSGCVTFRTDEASRAPITVLIALAVSPAAFGSTFSIGLVEADDGRRRWITLTAARQFVRIDGYASADGIFRLYFNLRDHPQSPADEGKAIEGDAPGAAAPHGSPAIGVSAIGYHHGDRSDAARALRERLLFA